MAAGLDPVIRVTGLNIFPIKSCKGFPVQEITIDNYGVEHDRRLMLIDAGNRFISQRKFPILATVTATYDETGSTLHVSSPKMDSPLTVPLKQDGARVTTTIWNDTVSTIDQGEAPAQWFSKLIGFDTNYVRLVASAERSPGFNRPITNYPESLKGRIPQMEITLTDAGPVSLISRESLDDLNERLSKQADGHRVPLTRFRMNIEITGCSKPFEEDDWLLVRIGNTPFLVYTENTRCKMTAVDQDTGEVDKLGPLEILRQYRAPRGPSKALFGQFMLPLQYGGKIQIGDTVTILDFKKK